MKESNSELLEESNTIEREKVQLNRGWSFWENYLKKNSNAYILEEIYSFDDIISFWQFWNKYPGKDAKKIFYNGEYLTYFFKEKYRINGMNLFAKGIKPEWEDEKNKNGKVFILEYEIKSNLDIFLSVVNDSWIKLLCYLIGEQLPYSDKINGVRFVDKTKLGKGIIFKFEVWVNSLMKEEKEIEELKSFLAKNFGCSGIVVKNL